MLEYFKLGTYLNRDGVYQKHSQVDLIKENYIFAFYCTPSFDKNWF